MILITIKTKQMKNLKIMIMTLMMCLMTMFTLVVTKTIPTKTNHI